MVLTKCVRSSNRYGKRDAVPLTVMEKLQRELENNSEMLALMMIMIRPLCPVAAT